MARIKIGDLIDDRYEVLIILGGKGISGRGVVYVCRDHETKEIIALKTLQKEYLKSESMTHAFKREALAWVHLERHPYIVRARYVINVDDRPFIGLDYIAPDKKGRNTLTHYFIKPIPLELALRWSIQFCHGMEYSVSRGITPHRDIKPDNIMISIDEIVKITDFGLAKFWGEKETISDWKEMAEEGKLGLSFLRISKGEIVGGTVPWMAPEQFEGLADTRSDIYAFGIVLYQMANNGERPFNALSIEGYYRAHKTGEVPVLKTKLFPIIDKCLKKDPDDRYQDFKELIIDLENLYKAEIGKAPPLPPKEHYLKAEEHNNKGVSFANLNFSDEAIKEFKEAIRIRPDYVKAHINLGLILIKKGLLDEAIKEFKDALQLEPYSCEIRESLGNALEAKGLIEEALQEYRQVVRIEPYYIEGHYNLARAYEAVGNFDDAIKLYRNFIEYSPKQPEYKKKVKEVRQRISKLKKTIKKIAKKKKKEEKE